MPNPADVERVLDLLNKATKADRDLDVEVFLLTEPPNSWVKDPRGNWSKNLYGTALFPVWQEGDPWRSAPAYTSDLGKAAQLALEKFPDAHFSIDWERPEGDGHGWQATIKRRDGTIIPPNPVHTYPTAAIALCAAVLAALLPLPQDPAP